MNIPKLRFKEFSREWEGIKLKEILEFKNGLNASKEQYGKGIKFINVLDILNNDFITYDNIIGKVDIDKKTLEKYSVNYGDVLFQRSSETREEVGMTNVYLDDKVATFGGFVIRGRKIGNYIPTFINKVLKTNFARNEIMSKSGGSTRYNVGQDILNEVQIIVPSLQEQEKIGNFLSSIDKKISLTEEKLNLFKDYKKGMMQKIFTQKIRFKDKNGNEFPDWVEKRLGDIGEIITGKTPATTQEKYWNGNIPFVTPTDMDNSKYQIKTLRTVSNDVKMKFLPIGTVMVTCIGATLGKMSLATKECITNQQINSLIVKENYNNEFIYYGILNIVPQIKTTQTSTTMPIVNKTEFSRLTINLPCLEEQEKIANFLSSIDNKIENLSKTLENLKEFKKGLLQKMFI